MAFVRGTTVGWSRRDLAEWLVCQYSPCVVHPADDEEPMSDRVSERASSVDELVVERVILDARTRALRLLGDLVVPWQASPIARLSVASGIVTAQREGGAVAYAPVGRRTMRLADRVTSLFVADYLNQPTDYRWLMLCRECGEMSFASELAHAAWCEAAPESWTAFTPTDAIMLAAGV